MKNLLYLFALTILLLAVSCGGGEATKGGVPKTVEEARKVLKEKRQALKKVKGEIAEIEAIIAQLDPSSQKEKETPVTVAKVQVKDFNHYVEVQGNVMPTQDPAEWYGHPRPRLCK